MEFFLIQFQFQTKISKKKLPSLIIMANKYLLDPSWYNIDYSPNKILICEVYIHTNNQCNIIKDAKRFSSKDLSHTKDC